MMNRASFLIILLAFVVTCASAGVAPPVFLSKYLPKNPSGARAASAVTGMRVSLIRNSIVVRLTLTFQFPGIIIPAGRDI